MMNKLVPCTVAVAALLLTIHAQADDSSLGVQLVSLTNPAGSEVAPPGRPSPTGPEDREGYYRDLAAKYYTKKLSDEQLLGAVEFFQSRPGRRYVRTRQKIERAVVATLMAAVGGMGPPPAPAQGSSERLALATKLVAVAGFEEFLESGGVGYEKIRLARGAKPKPGELSGRDQFEQYTIQLFAERLREPELTEIVAFFESSSGVAFEKARARMSAALAKQRG